MWPIRCRVANYKSDMALFAQPLNPSSYTLGRCLYSKHVGHIILKSSKVRTSLPSKIQQNVPSDERVSLVSAQVTSKLPRALPRRKHVGGNLDQSEPLRKRRSSCPQVCGQK